MKVGIIGGGASGMVAAITAAREGAEVVLFEKNDRIGKKILVTGNGRCNLSNLSFSASCYHSKEPEKAWELVSGFSPTDTVAFFEGIGLSIKDKNGYLYPACEQAAAVLDVLRYEIGALKICVKCEEAVTEIKVAKHGGFQLVSQNGKKTSADRVIVSCGGQASPKTGSDGSGYALLKKLGFSLVRPVPALVQLKCAEPLKAVAGIRCDARVVLSIEDREVACESGELQMTEYGISGIPVFQLSRHAAYGLAAGKKVVVDLDLLPWLEQDREAWILERLSMLRERSAEEFLTGTVNKKWIAFFLKRHGIRLDTAATEVSVKKWVALLKELKQFRLTVTDTNSFQNAQVCAGGVSLREVNGQLESVRIPGLYITGELLDIDGRCGGYNLQWAWGSGVVAGKAAALSE